MATATVAEHAIADNPVWYHTIEVAPGVVTPGRVDMRATAPKLLPEDLEGKRALDVGTFDGFWAFELEKRLADTVAIDLDRTDDSEWPPIHRESLLESSNSLGVELGRGFEIASGLLGSQVRRVACNVYDVSPAAVGGPVDIAFSGAILVHLRDPVRALERIRDTLAPGGALYVFDKVSIPDTILSRQPRARFRPGITMFNWWEPNSAALRAWLLTAGFTDVRGNGYHHPKQVKPMNNWYRGLIATRPAD